MDDKRVGTVKWFDTKKGFGFINSNNKDYFVHFSEIQTSGYKNLEEGQKVSFTLMDGKKGKQAAHVVIL